MSGETLEQAYRLLHRGYAVIDVPYKSKNPMIVTAGRTSDGPLRNCPSRFNGVPKNIGVLVGSPSGGRVDVDLDAPEVLALADLILPPTDARFGRPSKPNSHRIYLADPCPEAVERFKDVDAKRTTLVELRSDGGQTVFPGSSIRAARRSSGCGKVSLPVIDGRILRAQVAKLAAGALIARHWPPPPARDESGTRHDLSLALAGGLLRADWTEDDAREFITAIARVAGDEEARARGANVRTTARRLAGTEPKKATGWPTVSTLHRQGRHRQGSASGSASGAAGRTSSSTMRRSSRRKRLRAEAAPRRKLRPKARPVPRSAFRAATRKTWPRTPSAQFRPRTTRSRGCSCAAAAWSGRGRPSWGGRWSTRSTATRCSTRCWTWRSGNGTTCGRRAGGRRDHRTTSCATSAATATLPFPALAGITEAPIIRPDGTIVTTAGYDPITRLIYRP